MVSNKVYDTKNDAKYFKSFSIRKYSVSLKEILNLYPKVFFIKKNTILSLSGFLTAESRNLKGKPMLMQTFEEFSSLKSRTFFDLHCHLHGRSIQRSEVLLSLVSKRHQVYHTQRLSIRNKRKQRSYK